MKKGSRGNTTNFLMYVTGFVRKRRKQPTSIGRDEL